MADYNGVNYTKELAGVKPVDFMGPEFKAKERYILDTYEASSIAATKTIGVGKLKAGEVFLDAMVVTDALGGSTTLALGYTGSASAFIAAVSTAAAACLRTVLVDGVGYKPTADTEIILTVGGAAITGTIKTLIKVGAAQ